MRYSWPGNVRELQNVIERMMNYAQSDELTAPISSRRRSSTPCTL